MDGVAKRKCCDCMPGMDHTWRNTSCHRSEPGSFLFKGYTLNDTRIPDMICGIPGPPNAPIVGKISAQNT